MRRLFSPPFRWGLHLGRARVLLGLAALVNEVVRRFGTVSLLQVALALFVGYSLLVLRWSRLQGGSHGLLTLFTDTVFLLILANQSAGVSFWFPSLFFLLLMAEGIHFYSVREVAVVVAICAIFCLLARRPQLDVLLRPVVVGGALGIAFALYKRWAEARWRQLGLSKAESEKHAEESVDRAHQRVAQDFHDGPLQSYISLQMRLDILRKLFERDQAAGMQELLQLQELAQAQVRELRSFIRGLRGPLEVDSAGLMVAARRLAENLQKDSGIPVTFVAGDSVPEFSPEVSGEILQMLREALHNVQKHAGATRVAIGMQRIANTLEISVDDNGRGFRFSGSYNLDELDLLRLGPASIKRRARALNAELVLESRPGRGAGLKLRIPIS